jgi:phage tail protein X
MIVEVTAPLTVDDLVWRAFGDADTALVDQTINLNPGLMDRLASAGPFLPPGLKIVLPERRQGSTATQATVKLWD